MEGGGHLPCRQERESKRTQRAIWRDKRKSDAKNKQISTNKKLNLSMLQTSKLINKKYKKLKLLGSGELKDKVDIEVNFASNSATKKIEKVGGKVILVK